MAPRRRRSQVTLTDPVTIRALAHPARLAVIDELYGGAELTATECAELAGLSPSAMSYHLRALERAGIVERADGTGDGRERPWRAAGSSLRAESDDSRLGTAATAALTVTLLDRLGRQLRTWLDRSATQPKVWRDAVFANSSRVWLTAEEATEIGRLVLDRIDALRERDEPPAGSRRVRVGLFVFPVDEGQPEARR